ncbi:MAG TPA: hypothetical protein VM432_07080 [Bdellovibrionales bacterium]|nr:hypothetical protein [Bdellovibrionales bacterium]
MKSITLFFVASLVVCSAQAEKQLQCKMWGHSENGGIADVQASAKVDELGHAALRSSQSLKAAGFECDAAYVPPKAWGPGVVWMNLTAPNGMKVKGQEKVYVDSPELRIELEGNSENWDNGYCFCKFDESDSN